jgi:hypothetical protein
VPDKENVLRNTIYIYLLAGLKRRTTTLSCESLCRSLSYGYELRSTLRYSTLLADLAFLLAGRPARRPIGRGSYTYESWRELQF